MKGDLKMSTKFKLHLIGAETPAVKGIKAVHISKNLGLDPTNYLPAWRPDQTVELSFTQARELSGSIVRKESIDYQYEKIDFIHQSKVLIDDLSRITWDMFSPNEIKFIDTGNSQLSGLNFESNVDWRERWLIRHEDTFFKYAYKPFKLTFRFIHSIPEINGLEALKISKNLNFTYPTSNLPRIPMEYLRKTICLSEDRANKINGKYFLYDDNKRAILDFSYQKEQTVYYCKKISWFDIKESDLLPLSESSSNWIPDLSLNFLLNDLIQTKNFIQP